MKKYLGVVFLLFLLFTLFSCQIKEDETKKNYHLSFDEINEKVELGITFRDNYQTKGVLVGRTEELNIDHYLLKIENSSKIDYKDLDDLEYYFRPYYLTNDGYSYDEVQYINFYEEFLTLNHLPKIAVKILENHNYIAELRINLNTKDYAATSSDSRFNLNVRSDSQYTYIYVDFAANTGFKFYPNSILYINDKEVTSGYIVDKDLTKATYKTKDPNWSDVY